MRKVNQRALTRCPQNGSWAREVETTIEKNSTVDRGRKRRYRPRGERSGFETLASARSSTTGTATCGSSRPTRQPVGSSRNPGHDGSPVQHTNCHPFRHGGGLDAQRGDHRLPDVKRDLTLAVEPALFPDIEGSTDSELFFYLALTFGLEEDPPGAVARAVGLIEEAGQSARRAAPDPDDRGHHRRRDHVGVPLLQRGGSPGRCSTARTSRRYGRSIPTTRCCTISPTTRESWSPSHSETSWVPGARSRSPPA